MTRLILPMRSLRIAQLRGPTIAGQISDFPCGTP
jgi:hypothetical protein